MQKLLPIFLAVLFLAPDATVILPAPTAEPCQCPPVACHCAGHDHGAAHGPMCAFANGGHCGMKSAELPVAGINSNPEMLLPEAAPLPRLSPTPLESFPPPAQDQASFDTPPTPPPRFLA